jgi:hypothetical protein
MSATHTAEVAPPGSARTSAVAADTTPRTSATAPAPGSARTSEAPVEASAPEVNSSSAPAPATGTPKPAEPSAVATPKEKPLPVRQYLDATVVPTLRLVRPYCILYY